MRSRVKWFNDAKGFGFIEYDDSEDIFVHYSEIRKAGYKKLDQKDDVEFELVHTNKGLQARNVMLVNNR